MTTSKSHFEQILPEIYAKNFRKNNQKVRTDCLKPRSNKNQFERENCGCTDLQVLDYQNSSFKTLSKVKPHSDAVDYFNYFKELPFYNKPIEKPKFKRLKNFDRLADLPFYEQLSVIETDQAFKGYAMSHKVKTIEKKIQIYNQKQVNQVLKICLMIF